MVVFAAGWAVPRVRFFTGTLRHEPRLHDLPQRVELELVVSHQRQRRFRGVELDCRLRPLEIVPLSDFFARLIQRVVNFLQIDGGRDVERARRGHASILTVW
jgi:hypothetical protein